MDLLLRYLREHWRVSAGALLFAAINQIFSMADPFIFRRIIDGYVIPSRTQGQREVVLGAGLWLAAMVAATTVAWAAKTLQLGRVGQVSQKVASAMFADGVRHVIEMPYAEFEGTRSGETLDRLRSLRWNIERLVSGAINVLFVSFIGVGLVVAYATTVDWVLGLYLALAAIAMVALSIALSRTLRIVHDEAFRQGVGWGCHGDAAQYRTGEEPGPGPTRDLPPARKQRPHVSAGVGRDPPGSPV
jgi:ATP-binding cassette subfamily B protein